MPQLTTGAPIPAEILAERFGGRGHEEKSLSEILGDEPNLLIFLRHFG